MHNTYAHFMLIWDSCALVYLCVALPATQCIALQDFSLLCKKKEKCRILKYCNLEERNITDE